MAVQEMGHRQGCTVSSANTGQDQRWIERRKTRNPAGQLLLPADLERKIDGIS